MKLIQFSFHPHKLATGFGLIETIVAVSIFSIVAVTGMSTVLHSYSVNRLGANETEAGIYAQEGIDAVRSVKHQGWHSPFIADSATHSCDTGCGATSDGGTWDLKSGDDTSGVYTRSITIEDVYRDTSGDVVASGGTNDPDTKKVTSTVTWDFTTGRSNTVEVVTYLSRFEKPIPCGAMLSTSTSSDLNVTTAFALSWESASLNSTFFSFSASDPTKLVVEENGDYLIMLTLPLERSDTANTRTRVEADIRVNGTKQSVGVARSSFIRLSANHSESSNHFHVLLEDLTASDEIEIFVRGLATISQNVTITDSATLYAEFIPDLETVFTGTATQTTSGTNLNNTTAAELEWTESREDTGYTHSNATNPEDITIDNSGDYLVFVNVPLSGSVGRANIRGRILLDGIQVNGGQFTQGYIRNSNGDTESSIHWSGIVRATSNNQVLSVDVAREAAAGTITTGSENATIYIQELPSTGVYFGRGTALTNGTNWNPSSEGEILWSNDDIIDTNYYTHSTSSNEEQITIDVEGDYLLIYNDSLTASAGRPNPLMQVTLNGVDVLGAQSKTHYIRGSGGHAESSASLVFPMLGMEENDIVRMTVSREADTDTTNDNADALIALIDKQTCPIPNGAPTPTPTNTPTPTDTPTPTPTPDGPTDTPTPTLTPTPTYTPTPTPDPCPDDADCLDILTSPAVIGGGGDRQLRGLDIRRTDPTVITVEEMTVSWTLASRTMDRIRINGSNVWNGSANSGDRVDITDYSPAETYQNLNNIRFNSDMTGSSFTIDFHMSDGSTHSVNVDNPPDQ